MADTSDDEPADQQQSASPLLRLPAELRNRIYELALTRQGPRKMIKAWDRPGRQPGLTRTCRAIRAEALPIFYSINEFLTSPLCPEDEQVMSAWLRAIERENREHLDHVLMLKWDFMRYNSAVERFDRRRTRFLKRLKHSGDKLVDGQMYHVVKMDCLNFDD